MRGKAQVTVRPYEDAAHREGVQRLRARVYPDWPEVHDARWHDAVYRWLGTNPWGDGVRRWVLETGDGEVVGNLAAVPLRYRIEGRQVLAHTPTDYMTLPGYGFHALMLMRAFFRRCENYVACNYVPEATTIEKSLGAEEVGRLRYAAKAVDVAKYPNLPAAPLAAPLVRALGPALAAADRVLGAAFAPAPKVEEIEGFDDAFDRLFEVVAAAVPCVPEKDAAFLSWRYGPGNPQHPVTVLGVRDGEELLGYAALRATPQGAGYLLDLTAAPGRRDVARALLRGAVDHFRRAGVYVVRYRFVDSPTAPAPADLLRLGFFFRGGGRRGGVRRHTLLVKFADRDAHGASRDIRNWSYGLGDGEASFWVR